MSSTLFTGLSGLRSHQTFLDVIGNNIANANTVGYRGDRVTFGDLLSITISSGSAPTSTKGGKNPQQIGLGVGIKSIDRNTNPGSFLSTNRNLDLAIFGSGFFVVNDGTRNLYTRSGTFGLDASGQLVEVGTGFLVQSVSGGSIVVPPSAISPPQATSQVTIKGNLPATVTGPLEEILSTESPFQTGTSAQLDGQNAGPFSFNDGDAFTIEIDGGAAQTVTFFASDFTAIGSNIANATAADVAQIINNQITGATAADVGGKLVITSDSLGTQSKLKVTDVVGTPTFTLGLSSVLVTGTQTDANASTDLSDLVSNQTDYQNNDGILIEGIDKDGNDFAATFVYGVDGTTLGDLQAFLDNLVPGATVTLSGGNLVVTADEKGDAQFALTISDAPGSAGGTDWAQNAFVVTQNGADPDTVQTAITVFDKNGAAHVLNLRFERVEGSNWQLFAELPEEPNTPIADDFVANITFNSDGTLKTAGAAGSGDPDIEIVFATGAQTISLDLGDPGDINGVTQFGGPTTAQAVGQDGFAAGTLADVVVTENGDVRGVFTNGQAKVFGQLALVTFANPAGLARAGNTMFAETVNSGVPQVGSGGEAGGSIQSGILEASNVDLAEEFVRMIEAQRGYQAAARVIRASEDILQALLQNI